MPHNNFLLCVLRRPLQAASLDTCRCGAGPFATLGDTQGTDVSVCFMGLHSGPTSLIANLMVSCHRLRLGGNWSVFQDWWMIFGMLSLPCCQGTPRAGLL